MNEMEDGYWKNKFEYAFRFESHWEVLFYCIVTIALLIALVGGTMFAFSDKTFNGYYMSQCEGSYKVKIDWNNAQDTTAFRTYDGDEALRVLAILQAKQVKENE